MDIDLFSRLLETYGAALDRWPQDRRDAAARLLLSSAEARRKHAAAMRLDELLRLEHVDVDPARIGAIITAAVRRIHSRQRPTMSWRWLLAPPVEAVFAGMLALGCIVGAEVPRLSAGPAGHPAEPALGAFFDGSGGGAEGFIE
jgi:hypothetical protein